MNSSSPPGGGRQGLEGRAGGRRAGVGGRLGPRLAGWAHGWAGRALPPGHRLRPALPAGPCTLPMSPPAAAAAAAAARLAANRARLRAHHTHMHAKWQARDREKRGARSPPMTPGCVSTTFSSKSTMSSGLHPSSADSRRSSSGWCRAAAPSALPAAAGAAGAAPPSAAAGASPSAAAAAGAPPAGASRRCLMEVASSGVHCVCLLGLKPAVLRSRCRWMASIGMRRMGLGTRTCEVWVAARWGGRERGRGVGGAVLGGSRRWDACCQGIAGRASREEHRHQGQAARQQRRKGSQGK